MSRSYRYSMIHGIATSVSEKECKRKNNRRLRRRVNQTLNTCVDFEEVILPIVREVSNPWSMAKDGKVYSNWLANYRATMEKVSRTRDGVSRWNLVLTERTYAHHDSYISRPRHIFRCMIYFPEKTIEQLREENPLSNPLGILHK